MLRNLVTTDCDGPVARAARLLSTASAMREEGWGHEAADHLIRAAHDLIALAAWSDTGERMAA